MRLDEAEFGDRLLSLVSASMPLAGCCFYRVEDGQYVLDHQLFRLSNYWLNSYYHHFWRLDPLHPSKAQGRGARLMSLTRDTVRANAEARDYFEQFLLPQKTTHQTELYFRQGDRIVAGASLLRDDAIGAFTRDNFVFLERLVEFAESSAPWQADDRRPEAVGSLTPRERDIAHLVAAAVSNKEICRRLDIRLPTVKTHVSRILAKAGVHSRAEFIRKMHA